jgi:MbtH protein
VVDYNKTGKLLILTSRYVQEWCDMVQDQEEDTRKYTVVVNHEQQYSIWLEGRKLPAGWTPAGFSGDKKACLSYIEEVWTDMRPLSLRKKTAKFDKMGNV